MLKQLKDASMTVGYVGGWCLKYVQDAFGTDHPYPTALSAWNNNYGGGNHVGLPPMGVTVPVYFSLGTEPAGHVAIRLDDGMVASSTLSDSHARPYFHKDINDLVAVYGKYNGGCRYLGWSEYVGTVRVVQESQVNATDDQIRAAYLDILGRPVDAGALVHYRAYTNAFVRQDLLNSNEYKTVLANRAAATAAVVAAKALADAKAKADAEVAAKALADQLAREKALADQKAADEAAIKSSTYTPADRQRDDSIYAIVQWIKELLTKIFK